MIRLFKSVALTATLLTISLAHAATESSQAVVEQKSTSTPQPQVKVTSWADYAHKKADLKAQKKSKAITKAEFQEKKKELKMAYKAYKKEAKEEYKAKRKALKEERKALKAKEQALKEERKALKAKEKAAKKELKEKMKAEKKEKGCKGMKEPLEKAY